MLAAKPPNFSQPEARHAPGSSAGLCCESFSPHSAAIPIVEESGLVAESEEVGDSSTESAEPLPLFDECDANEDGTELDRGCRDGVPPARGRAGPAGEDEIASVLLFGEWACCCRVLPETRSGRDDGGVDIRATAAGPAPSRVDMTSESAGTSLGEWCETAANKLPGGKPQPVAACTSAAFFCSFSVALFCMSSTVLVQLLTPPDQGKPLAPSAPAPDAKRSMAPSPTCHGHFPTLLSAHRADRTQTSVAKRQPRDEVVARGSPNRATLSSDHSWSTDSVRLPAALLDSTSFTLWSRAAAAQVARLQDWGRNPQPSDALAS